MPSNECSLLYYTYLEGLRLSHVVARLSTVARVSEKTENNHHKYNVLTQSTKSSYIHHRTWSRRHSHTPIGPTTRHCLIKWPKPVRNIWILWLLVINIVIYISMLKISIWFCRFLSSESFLFVPYVDTCAASSIPAPTKNWRNFSEKDYLLSWFTCMLVWWAF